MGDRVDHPQIRLQFLDLVPTSPWMIAEQIGPVTADLGNTACEVPSAADSIRKVENGAPSGRSA